MQTVLHSDPVAASMALERLGLHQDVLLNAALQGHQARANSTPNHPPLHASFVAWSEAVRALRDGLAPDGWVRSNEKNWPRAIHPNGHIALTVATGNESTGRPDETPATTSSKGPSTISALEVNRAQLWLPGLEPVTPDAEDEKDDGPTTWLLLIHHAKDEVRSELALPLDVDGEGRVSVWRERIILRAMPLDPEVADIAPPPQPDIDVAIRRKA